MVRGVLLHGDKGVLPDIAVFFAVASALPSRSQWWEVESVAPSTLETVA